MRDRWRVVNATAAAVFIMIGVLVATGRFEVITQQLSGVGFSAFEDRLDRGNRPQFVKAAHPQPRAARAHDEVLVHSGQHYDPELADLFFDELGVPQPDHALEVGSGAR